MRSDTLLGEAIGNTRRAGLLKRFGIHTVLDALTYYPFRVTPPVPQLTLRQAKVGQPGAFHARISDGHDIPFHTRRGSRLVFRVSDAGFDDGNGASTAEMVFFTAKRPYARWMLARLSAGQEIVFSGTPSFFEGLVQFTHPEVVRIPQDYPTAEAAFKALTVPRPVYHASARLSSDKIHETILSLIERIRQVDSLSGGAEKQDSVDRSAESSEVHLIESPAANTTARPSESPVVPTVIPQPIREKHGLMRRFEAFQALHDPRSVDEFKRALKTLRYEEAYISQLALLQARESQGTKEAFACPQPDWEAVDRQTSDTAQQAEKPASSLVERLLASLPFSLTEGQKKVCRQISEDMSHDHPMQRLLQGEVGSGKTLVALLAMLQAVDAGYQAVLVAPTQVLAEQHATNLQHRLHTLNDDGGPKPPDVLLLTGALRTAQRRRLLARVASGEPCLIVATHAAFSSTFQAPRLALAVIDEQHRFGVDQRDVLLEKSEKTPHLLVMTATPIPRTAAMTWFGDLQVSELEGLPGGRKPISTFIIDENSPRMADVFGHLAWRIRQFGERAYIVCPAIETADPQNTTARNGANNAESVTQSAHAEEGLDLFTAESPDSDEESEESLPLYSVQEIASILPTLPQLQGISVATLTGRDDAETKERVMRSFQSGETPILVATTVIEVGVDVPQASSIVIFDADHFGLSQLHQLRGRVGRGGTPGWAFLISRAAPDSVAAQRLQVIASTQDGKKISEADLDLRGAGDVLGDTQAGGKSSFKLLRVVKDARLIESARADAEQTLAADPNLAHDPALAGAVLDFRRGNEDYLTKN